MRRRGIDVRRPHRHCQRRPHEARSAEAVAAGMSRGCSCRRAISSHAGAAAGTRAPRRVRQRGAVARPAAHRALRAAAARTTSPRAGRRADGSECALEGTRRSAFRHLNHKQDLVVTVAGRSLRFRVRPPRGIRRRRARAAVLPGLLGARQPGSGGGHAALLLQHPVHGLHGIRPQHFPSDCAA